MLLKEIFALLCSQLQAEEKFNPRQDLYLVSIKFLHDFQIRLAILRLSSLRSNLRSNSAKFVNLALNFTRLDRVLAALNLAMEPVQARKKQKLEFASKVSEKTSGRTNERAKKLKFKRRISSRR